MVNGKIPFVGASSVNNGVTNYINADNLITDKNLLGVNFNGSVGEAFYHPYDCVFSSDVKRLHLKANEHNNKETLLFAKQSIISQKEKYSYGYKFNKGRMKHQKILLPVDSNGNINYDFMNNYIKKIEVKKCREYLKFVKENNNVKN